MRVLSTFLLLLLGLAPGALAQSAQQVDDVFAAFVGTDLPGCAVGVSQDGEIVLERAYGMANLEFDVINTPMTIFEPGSVSKQFTAAATILLALDGAVSLDEDIRSWVPELPDYGEPITLRHLMTHTSGLRDWGSVAGISGWSRTTRTHTHVHALDIASRQLELNYPPGTYYSYTNTGYNLQAIIVERVSGMSFAEFSRTRIFEPLGLHHTEWRDDYTRVVKDRATAYRPNQQTGGFNMLMPFENVHGNGGLLTTVGDLLRFTWYLETGPAAFREEMHRQGVLNNGVEISYASGLVVGTWRGVPEIRHSGATAGYRGYLARYPDQGVAVAVMCNTAGANATALARSTAELWLGDALSDDPSVAPEPIVRLSRDRLEDLAGGFRNTRNQSYVVLTATTDGLMGPGGRLVPETGMRFRGLRGEVLVFDSDDTAFLAQTSGDTLRYERVERFEPDEGEMDTFEGSYHSPEAEVTYRVVREDARLMMLDRYGNSGVMTPLYTDAFRSRLGTVVFTRDGRGRIDGFRASQGRVWSLRFDRSE
ncbi:MAG: beta-lactamase family protein [Rhodothermales bacterium]|nr:beta-lactamase family protein [Rhodothermales bacterium]MBO6780118.1 beta-lactamase family protein [Rhodothermales bacterium]